MKDFIEDYENKLYEFYSITGIPVSLITDINVFQMLYPKIPTQPTYNMHSKTLQNYIDEVNLPLHKPYVKHIFLSCFYCILRLDDNCFVQLGPVAAKDINIKAYISFLQSICPSDVVTHHMKLIQGAPRTDLNYFVRAVILATHFLCNHAISKQDILFDNEISNQNLTDTKAFWERTAISVDQLSFENEIYHVVQEGNILKMQEFLSPESLISYYYFQENDIHFLRIAFIFYGSILCHYASLGGLDGKTVRELFRDYIQKIYSMEELQDFWEHLPLFLKTLCYAVHDLKKSNSNSNIVRTCTEYIKNNIYSKISLQDLEQHTSVSRKTILRHFNEYLHMTPSEYISNLKLKEIAYLLEHSDMELIDISTMYSYSSQSHMNRNFMKKYGCTPLQYRKIHQM